MSSAREAILGLVREANSAPVGGLSKFASPMPREYRRRGTRAPSELLELLEVRIADYRADVFRCPALGLAEALGERLETREVRSLVVPSSLPDAWIQGTSRKELEIRRDHESKPLSVPQIASTDCTLSGCAIAIAETGTLVLDGGEAQGRRVLTLLPDYHLCVVFQRQVMETVPEAMEALETNIKSGTTPITFISGPSATSDIELIRVEGVHGPRTLDVILVEDG